MVDTAFRSAPEPVNVEPHESEFVENKVGAEISDTPEPLEGEKVDNAVLDVIGLDDTFHDLPSEEQSKVKEITNFLTDVIKAKGKTPTVLSLSREMDSIKAEMGLDYDANPVEVIDRVSGVIKAYKNISFLKGDERRSIFMKLARLPDSKSMNKMVFDLMENKKIWT